MAQLSFRLAILILIAGAGCATAAKDQPGGGTPDAGKGDNPNPTPDAALVDAPMMMTDAPSGTTCASAMTCASATMLGSVSGDSGNVKLTASGHQSAWYRVRVTEDDSTPFGLSLRAGAKLTSPSGAQFDVFIYLNTGSDVVECNTTVGSATTAGATKTVHAEWGESGTFSNGSDDGRNASIEIRPVSGTCAPNQMWQLEVEGNWL